MKRYFLFFLLVLSANLFANPNTIFTKTLSWIGKSEADVISAGGIKYSEANLQTFGRGIQKIYHLNNVMEGLAVILNNDIVTYSSFTSAIVVNERPYYFYNSENDFISDVNSIIQIVRSMNGYVQRDSVDRNGDRTVIYRIMLDNNIEISFNVYYWNKDKIKNNYGFYQINITLNI